MKQAGECPCCGQPIEGIDFKVSLEFNSILCGAVALTATPTQTEILFVLRKHFPKNIHKERLISAVWGSKPVSDSCFRTFVYQARKTAEMLGYTIRHSVHEGYRLSKL